MKYCKKCGDKKKLTDFFRNYKSKDGLLNSCKVCCLAYMKIYEKKKDYEKQKDIENKKRYGIGRRTIVTFGLKLALDIYDKANRKCEKCMDEHDLTIHHKDGNGRHNQEKGLPMNNDRDNLIVLCRSCHGAIHSREYWSKNKKSEVHHEKM